MRYYILVFIFISIPFEIVKGKYFSCFLFNKRSNTTSTTKGQCCTSVKIETIGGGNFYQGERMGNYGRVSNTPDGRLVYKQTNGDNYLYFLQNQGVSINCMVPLHLKINFWALSSFGWLEDKLVEIQAES